MKSLLIMLPILCAAPAMAMRGLTPAEEAEIQFHVDRGRRAASEDVSLNPHYAEALAEKRRLDRVMGIGGNRDGSPERAPSAEDLGKLHGWFHDDREKYARVAAVVNAAQHLRDEEYNRAIQLALSYAGIGPGQSQGIAQNNLYDPRMRGQSISWAPRFSSRLEPGEESRDAFLDRPSLIRPDGAVVLRETAFNSIPELLSDIRHEAMHYNLLLSDREYGLIEPETERLIQAYAMANEETTRLGTAEWRKLMYTAEGEDWLAREWRRKMQSGMDPAANRAAFPQDMPPAVRAAVVASVDSDLAMFAVLDGSMDSLDYLKATAHAQFFKSLSDAELRGIVNGWHLAQRHDAEAPQWKMAVAKQDIALEASQCGFTMQDDWSFYSKGVLGFMIRHGGDVAVAKAGLLLMNACLKEGRPQQEPCNDAMSVISQRWSNEQFRSQVMKGRMSDPLIDGESEEGQCLLYLRDNWKPRGDFADLKAAIEKHYAIWREQHGMPPATGNPSGGNGGNGGDRKPPPGGYDGPCGNGGSLCGGNRPHGPNF